MIKKLPKGTKRSVFIVDTTDFEVLNNYAKEMGFTASILLREAAYRIAKEIHLTGKTLLVREPIDSDNHYKNIGKQQSEQ